jgi:hypothetical protein
MMNEATPLDPRIEQGESRFLLERKLLWKLKEPNLPAGGGKLKTCHSRGT